METERIPVTIITGFLGAGKTTLINHLIDKYKQKKFAIIENEFGEIGIDGGLIVAADENIFELTNGCICCSLNNDFYETLTRLLNSTCAFNHLLVETTGIADPTNVINAFLSTELVQSRFILDSVVCLADATYVEDLLKEQPEVQLQLALSDKILLNKADSVQPGYMEELRIMLSGINPMAEIYPVSYGETAGIRLLDTYSYSSGEIKKTTLAFQFIPQQQIAGEPEQSLFVQHQQKPHLHCHEITSEGFRIPGKFDLGKFSLWMENFLYFNQATIFRAKGILNFCEMSGSYVFQAVREKYVLEKCDEPIAENKLVFIGKNIDRNELGKGLLQLVKKETIKVYK